MNCDDYTGAVIATNKHSWYTEWMWTEDTNMHMRTKFTVREFIVSPEAPDTTELFNVRTTDSENVMCYASGGLLIELVAKEETETMKKVSVIARVLGGKRI